MNESAKEPSPIFTLAFDADEFKLVALSIERNDDNTHWVKRTPCSRLDTYKQWKKTREEGHDGLEFYTSCLILTEAESSQRRLLKRITKPNSRNISLATEITAQYLKQSLEKAMLEDEFPYTKFTEMSLKDKKKSMTKISIKQMNNLLQEAFIGIKQQLGFPEKNPCELGYKITPEVVAAAKDDKCITRLKQHLPTEYIFRQKFETICQDLRENYSSDAEKVIEALQKTESRDHLAVFSITTQYNQNYVSMVNDLGSYVKMESWKFLNLIENSDIPRRLHEFVKRKMNNPDDPFEFNNNKEGCVVGKFNAEQSWVDIACLNSDTEATQDRATFIVDSTYVLCLYTTLKRLEQDKERFTTLQQQANTAMNQIKDPFELLPRPFL